MPSRRRASGSPRRSLPEKTIEQDRQDEQDVREKRPGPVRLSMISSNMDEDRSGASAGNLLAAATKILSAAGIEDARSEARLLLQEVLNVSRAWLMAHAEAIVSPDQGHRYESSVQRRAYHEPAAYITGHKEFFGLDLEVGPAVLIPRPETEILLEMAIGIHERLSATKGRDLQVADVGTGSGAIAIALAVRCPEIHIVAVDASPEALELARRNAGRLGVASRIDFRHGNLLEGVGERLDLLVANLPYVPSDEVDRLMPEVARYEPRTALDGGPDGTLLIRRALEQAVDRLELPAALLFEIGDGQGNILSQYARDLYPGADVRVIRDYAGLERVLSIQL